MELLIVTGLSGAGKSLAVNALEDIGYFCIDNIPSGLVPRLLEFAQQGENMLNKVAVVLDVRGARSPEEVAQALKCLDEQDMPFQILFLDASDDVLERRYKETRRRHPISLSQGLSTEDAIHAERVILQPLYERADYVVDTSLLTTAQHKERICSLFLNNAQKPMALTIMSFGFKYGLPKEADIVYDVRCLPNPFYVEALKDKTGMDQEVSDYVMQFDESRVLLEKLESLLNFSLPLYIKEGKSQLTIAVGCTGGRHRSVTFAKLIGDYFQKQGYGPTIQHRDVNRTL